MARFDRIIPPGGEGKITLEVHTKGFSGGINKGATVISNDPKNPRLIVRIKGKLWTPIRVSPRYVRLKGIRGEKIGQVIRLSAEKFEPLELRVESVSIPQKVRVELDEVEEGRNYVLRVANKVETEGKYSGQIKLATNYSEKPEIVIRVMGSVNPLVEVRPRTVDFGRVPEARLSKLKMNHKYMGPQVMILLHKGRDLKIEKVELRESLFSVDIREIHKGKAIRISLQPIVEKLTKGQSSDVLKVYTNQVGYEVLEVPISIDII